MSGLRGWALPIGALVAAELAFRALDVTSDAFAPPSLVLQASWRGLLDGTLLHATAQTLVAAFGGLALGAGVGIFLGIVFGLSRFMAGLSFLSIELLRPIPAIALIPLSMLVFGFGYRMEIAVVAFAAFWPAVILSQYAVASVHVRLLEVARSLCMGRLRTMWSIILPAAAPRLFTATRLAAGLSLAVAVTVEIVANPQGLGYTMTIAQQTLYPDMMLANFVWLGLVGWAFNAGLLRLELVMFREQGRGPEPAI